MKILVTGAIGFIGFHLTKSLLNNNHDVIGVDNLNSYYDPKLKKARLRLLEKNINSDNFKFFKVDISNKSKIENIFNQNNFDCVINLAAQAGVRYSIDNPDAYVESNIVGFLNILEGCRLKGIDHLIYASSSSVYGMNAKQPFATDDRTDYPISLYAASKKSNELMAYSYSHLYGIPTTGLRFFTVYGPYGRPDMAYFKFADAIKSGKKIDVYNDGKMLRDFTYIDDIVEAITKLIYKYPEPVQHKGTNSKAPYKIYNIGNNKPISLERFISSIESALQIKAIKNYMPMQPGDVPLTYANVDNLIKDINFKPNTTIEDGMKSFIDWFKDYK